MENEKPLLYFNSVAPVHSCLFARPDILACGDENGYIHVWDIRSQLYLRTNFKERKQRERKLKIIEQLTAANSGSVEEYDGYGSSTVLELLNVRQQECIIGQHKDSRLVKIDLNRLKAIHIFYTGAFSFCKAISLSSPICEESFEGNSQLVASPIEDATSIGVFDFREAHLLSSFKRKSPILVFEHPFQLTSKTSSEITSPFLREKAAGAVQALSYVSCLGGFHFISVYESAHCALWDIRKNNEPLSIIHCPKTSTPGSADAFQNIVCIGGMEGEISVLKITKKGIFQFVRTIKQHNQIHCDMNADVSPIQCQRSLQSSQIRYFQDKYQVRLGHLMKRLSVTRSAGSITTMKFRHDGLIFCCGGSSGTTTLYSTKAIRRKTENQFSFLADLQKTTRDTQLVEHDGNLGSLGRHRGGLSCISWCDKSRTLATSGFDSKINIWGVYREIHN